MDCRTTGAMTLTVPLQIVLPNPRAKVIKTLSANSMSISAIARHISTGYDRDACNVRAHLCHLLRAGQDAIEHTSG